MKQQLEKIRQEALAAIRLFADAVYKILDFVGNMGNHLNGGAKVLSSALLVQNVPVDFAGGQIGILIQILVDKSFIVPEVKIGFSSVLGHVHLTVLIRTHCAGVYVDIRV